VPSKALVEGLKAVAERAAERVLADPALRAALVGCTPAGPDDAGCFREFVARFGRRALRRPLADADVQAYAGFLAFGTAAQDFHTAVGMVVRAMLQAYRAHDEGKPACTIDGKGELANAGAFRGPAELGTLLVTSGRLTSCLVERLVQFASGRGVQPSDDALLQALASRGGGAELQLRRLLLDWVSSEGFRTRIIDER
jgi:Protein of unknown function (DUF1595)/Protein of unknown function (DUF1585)